MLITVRQEDFDKLDTPLLSQMLSEVSCTKEDEALVIRRLTRTQPKLEVGIMSAKEIVFEILSDGAGPRKASLQEGKIQYDGALYDELYFGEDTLSTMFAQPSFVLHDVVIGKGFHWQQAEDQRFAGALKIVAGRDCLTAVNVVGVEDYLLSVISSEMKSTSSLEFLKAHAVISRSWVMSQIKARDARKGKAPEMHPCTLAHLVTSLDAQLSKKEAGASGTGDYVKWYDRSQHKDYDVCADDHCQRYQGLTRAVGQTVRKAVDLTWGQVLTYGGEICDARFSKCCGGVTERFSACWEDKDYDYLPALPDTPGHDPEGKPFCDTSDPLVLTQVLNNYDRSTTDFYRWEQEYSKEEITNLIISRSGTDIGELVGLRPLERGGSGRITLLEVVGTKASFKVGKELEIRRILSDSHLRSSAFEPQYRTSDGTAVRPSDRSWSRLVLKGSGWGHGVGLCQIGAAVMASQGYGFREILNHYYPGAVVGSIPSCVQGDKEGGE
ncbi:MAG: SpoIID/LytB domain-containing protein [Candidatus Cryptobacteroides sp.]